VRRIRACEGRDGEKERLREAYTCVCGRVYTLGAGVRAMEMCPHALRRHSAPCVPAHAGPVVTGTGAEGYVQGHSRVCIGDAHWAGIGDGDEGTGDEGAGDEGLQTLGLSDSHGSEYHELMVAALT
jgi:hypothetical protein